MAGDLSDRELRQQLIALGEKNIGPVTGTTRALYVKKLNSLVGSQKLAGRGRTKAHTPRKLVGLSSDESEDDAPVVICEVKSSGRGKASPTRTTRRTARGQTSDESPSPLSRPKARPPLRAHRRRASDNGEPDTRPIPGASRVAARRSAHPASQFIDDPDGFQSSDTDEEEDNLRNTSQNEHTNMVNRSINTSAHLDNSAYWNSTFRSNTSPRVENSESNTPSNSSQQVPSTLSNRRSHSTRNRGRRSNTVYVANNIHRDNPSANHVDSSLFEEEKILKSGFKTKEEPASKCSQYVSMVLVVLTVLFFAVLTFLYMGMKSEGAASLVVSPSTDDDWMLCPDDKKSADCFTNTEATIHRSVLLVMAECLNHAAVDHFCDSRASDRVQYNDLLKWVKTEMDASISSPDLTSSLKAATQLILHNPHWSIKMYDAQGAVTTEPSHVEAFARMSPNLPLWCRLSRSTSQVLLAIGVLLLVAVVSLVMVKCLQYRWKRQREEMAQVYHLVERIIDILKSHSDCCKDKPDMEPYLAIPHVRDMLIPLKDRERRQPLWEKARKFLSANESRVREETQKIAGEEFIVWRWLQVCPNGNKVWQGQAFGENREGSLNSPPYSLTQCLKVRNMFDPDMECEENWHVRIQDAILEKCGPDHRIMHVAVDTTSQEGCVYMKCSDADAAGHAYKALHGWWFDGKLVTVKYLRLERYYERFPDAAHCVRPLMPSNNQRLSLSQPYFRSVIETS